MLLQQYQYGQAVVIAIDMTVHIRYLRRQVIRRHLLWVRNKSHIYINIYSLHQLICYNMIIRCYLVKIVFYCIYSFLFAFTVLYYHLSLHIIYIYIIIIIRFNGWPYESRCSTAPRMGLSVEERIFYLWHIKMSSDRDAPVGKSFHPSYKNPRQQTSFDTILQEKDWDWVGRYLLRYHGYNKERIDSQICRWWRESILLQGERRSW